MIISRTPYRISFFGGGTDYPAWYRQYGGTVLATTIDKYCYLTCRYLPPVFEHRIRVVFSKSGEIGVRPVTVASERVHELNSHLLLFFTGIKRTASEVAESYVNDVTSRAHHLQLIGEMVDEGIAILRSGEDISRFGKLLGESWQAKRSLGRKVSNSHVEEIYSAALGAGAIGGKLTGAGGGGFLLLFVPPADQRR